MRARPTWAIAGVLMRRRLRHPPAAVMIFVVPQFKEIFQMLGNAKLPMMTQWDALSAIFTLTCEEIGNAKKIMETVAEAARSLRENQKPGVSASSNTMQA